MQHVSSISMVVFVGLCYILSMSSLPSKSGGLAPPFVVPIVQQGGHRGAEAPPYPRGLRGVGSPPLQGLGQRPEKNFFGPYIRWANLPMVLCMILGAMVFGPWYWMLRHVYICIVTYERNIMKNQIW